MNHQVKVFQGYLAIPVHPGMTDDEIRELAVKCKGGNTEYIYEVCRQCGVYCCTQDSHTKDAKVLDVCNLCVNIPIEEIEYESTSIY